MVLQHLYRLYRDTINNNNVTHYEKTYHIAFFKNEKYQDQRI